MRRTKQRNTQSQVPLVSKRCASSHCIADAKVDHRSVKVLGKSGNMQNVRVNLEIPGYTVFCNLPSGTVRFAILAKFEADFVSFQTRPATCPPVRLRRQNALQVDMDEALAKPPTRR